MGARIFGTVLLLLVAACADKSPYAPGKSAADVPARIDVIKLVRLADLSTWASADELEAQIDPDPSPNDREVMDIAKRTVIAQFENFGIHIVEDDGRPPDLRIAVYIAYQPEIGIAHRGVRITIAVLDDDGTMILKERKIRQVGGAILDGLVLSLFSPRDDMVQGASREVVQAIVKDLQQGTKTKATADAKARPPAVTPETGVRVAVPGS